MNGIAHAFGPLIGLRSMRKTARENQMLEQGPREFPLGKSNKSSENIFRPLQSIIFLFTSAVKMCIEIRIHIVSKNINHNYT